MRLLDCLRSPAPWTTFRKDVEYSLDNPEQTHRFAALECMLGFYKTLRSAGHVLTAEEFSSCEKFAHAFLLHQNALSMMYWERKRKLYNITFKSHLFWHMSRFYSFVCNFPASIYIYIYIYIYMIICIYIYIYIYIIIC